jgi:hypothetical protein
VQTGETKCTSGRRACSWWRLAVKVEVDERVELLERERLRRLVIDEHTLPFLRGLLLALEHNHFIVLENMYERVRGIRCGMRVKAGRTNVGCRSLDPDCGHLLARVHFERAWLGRVYRRGLVIIYESNQLSRRVEENVIVGETLRTAKGVKVALGKGLAPLCWLSLASFESLCERGAYADVVPSCSGYPR